MERPYFGPWGAQGVINEKRDKVFSMTIRKDVSKFGYPCSRGGQLAIPRWCILNLPF